MSHVIFICSRQWLQFLLWFLQLALPGKFNCLHFAREHHPLLPPFDVCKSNKNKNFSLILRKDKQLDIQLNSYLKTFFTALRYIYLMFWASWKVSVFLFPIFIMKHFWTIGFPNSHVSRHSHFLCRLLCMTKFKTYLQIHHCWPRLNYECDKRRLATQDTHFCTKSNTCICKFANINIKNSWL